MCIRDRSKNAKRTAYAHITFNFIGVLVVLALFYPAIQVLTWVMGFFGGDPGTPTMIDGKEVYPLVPVAIGLFSIFFNIFNVIILFPFVNTFERYLSRVGRTEDEDIEDYSVPRFLDKGALADFRRALPAVQQEQRRALAGAALFLDIARGRPGAPKAPAEHHEATDALSREIRAYSAQLFDDRLSRPQKDLVASTIEEVDFTAALSESLHQIARRVCREKFSAEGQSLLNAAMDRLDASLTPLVTGEHLSPRMPAGHSRQAEFEDIRWRIIDSGPIPAGEKGALLALLGSMERAEVLIDRIADERQSVDRGLIHEAAPAPARDAGMGPAGLVPAE